MRGKKRRGENRADTAIWKGKKKKNTAILPKYHYRDKMERFGILSNYKDLQMCIKYIPPS